ncbi:tumor necrosis factor receptor superfamily member 5 isoform X3 [Manis pentadactyla]|uniref:tumor necrosis factor receptor superfamily member 5 isoform X3 n=1 Tax=Manis pentadactyla TaxID=143292 RepID=UPI00255C8A0D|nr:tumor necrosis factor receptor superfamily member 5 isoform X3 [Manis pentadactyla]
MVRLPLQCLFWACSLTAVHPEPPTACRENQYLTKSQCCNLCRPGEKLVNDCTKITDTECLPCSKGEFLDTWNRETHCHQHKYCDPNLGLQVQMEGTLQTDTICTCDEGHHCTSNACESCTLHSMCPPGLGVKQMATGVSDTICEPCPVGYFSNISSTFEKCHPWTSCEMKNLVQLQPGTDKTDAICGFRDRMRALVVIPIAMGVLFAVLLVSACIGRVAKKPQNKARHPKFVWQSPTETTYVEEVPVQTDSSGPVQETLHGCQPVTQEDGKESRISVQERQ